MNSLIPKVIGGALAVSIIGTGTYFGVKELTKGETLREKLTKEKFKLISSNDNDQWNLEFESDKAEIKSKLGDHVVSGVKLKEECEKMLDSRDDKNIHKVKKWCGIRSISNQLLRAKRTFLVNDKSSDVDASWKATYGKRKTDSSPRDKLGLEGAWTQLSSNLETTDLPKVKEWCKGQENEDYSKTKEEIYKLVDAWCTKEGLNLELK